MHACSALTRDEMLGWCGLVVAQVAVLREEQFGGGEGIGQRVVRWCVGEVIPTAAGVQAKVALRAALELCAVSLLFQLECVDDRG